MITTEMLGGERIKAQMLQLSQRELGDAIAAGTMAGALLVVNAAVGYAPVLTGTLRRSIHAEFGEAPTVTGAVVYVGTDLVYAARQEYGFIGQDSLGRNYNQAGSPYMRPALDENVENVKREIKAAVTAALAAAMAS